MIFKNLRIMNGNSNSGFGGAVQMNGAVDFTCINCEFGGSLSESLTPSLAAGWPPRRNPGAPRKRKLLRSPPRTSTQITHAPCYCPIAAAAGGDGGALGIVSTGVVKFIDTDFYDNIWEWGCGGASASWRCVCVGGGGDDDCTEAMHGLLAAATAVGSAQPAIHTAAHKRSPLPASPTAVSTTAETWFANCQFENNNAGMYGGAVLLEGGCPAGYFIEWWFNVSNV